MFNQDEKILLGNSIPLPEVDVDENNNDELTQKNALKGYWFATILNTIGRDVFKSNYLTVIDDIKNESSLKEQKGFCYIILKRIKNVYNFEFPIILEFNNLEQIYDLYEFLEFLEYDYKKFICNIWKFLRFNICSESIEYFCKNDSMKIIKQIDDQINLGFYPSNISMFLKTYNKEYLINWFYKASKKVRSEILVNYMEEKEK